MLRSSSGQVFMRRNVRIVMAAALTLIFMASIGVTDAHATVPQDKLIITNATRTATVGRSVTLTSTEVSNTRVVTATKPSDGTYASKTSPALQFRFNAA
jgi:hypothetical protein